MSEIQLAGAIEVWPIEKLKPYDKNARTHSPEQVDKISSSIIQFGFNNPILVDGAEGIIAGHGRLEAAKKLGMKNVPVVVLTHLSEAKRRAYIIADNKLAELAGWDRDLLKGELEWLDQQDDLNMDAVGFSDAEMDAIMAGLPEIGPEQPQTQATSASAGGLNSDGSPSSSPSGFQDTPLDPPKSRKLSDDFIVPPFSILDQRQGYWRARRDQWLSLGIKSEIGRGGNLLGMSETVMQPDPELRSVAEQYEELLKSNGVNAASLAAKIPGYYNMKNQGMSDDDIVKKFLETSQIGSGTSIFDPVLCELGYRWFSPQGGTVLDPFAGGSVRGIVASKLGLQYIGCELRQEQVDENRKQATEICNDPMPIWACGDSRHIDKHCQDVKADFIFSCPPYHDLEVYSEAENDISNMSYEEFLKAYREIILISSGMLKPDRFAMFVITEIREKTPGFYKNFVRDTIEAFEDAGLRYYNEMILVNSVGTLPIRVGRMFSSSRKVGRTHQNVLVFCKGDPMKAVEACGQIEVKFPFDVPVPIAAASDVVENKTEPSVYGEKLESIGGEV